LSKGQKGQKVVKSGQNFYALSYGSGESVLLPIDVM